MTNEWGPPLTGEEMKALKGRIDPETLINRCGSIGAFKHRVFGGRDWHLPANHPYYKVRECNQKHGTNLVLHDGNDKVPDDFDPNGLVLGANGQALKCLPRLTYCWSNIIAYTPKPKESEVTEEMPSDEAIEYVLRTSCSQHTVQDVKNYRASYATEILAARLIQQYEPDRLRSAVDVAAEEWATSEGMFNPDYFNAFKAGAAWQKENGQ